VKNYKGVYYSVTVASKRGAARWHLMRQLQDDHDDAVEAQPKRRTGVQRLRTVLQTAQREYLALHSVIGLYQQHIGKYTLEFGSLLFHGH
jgi:hypothetical protein